MAKKFSDIKNQLSLGPDKEGWKPVSTYRELQVALARRNLRRTKDDLLLEPKRALRFLREYQDTGRSRAEFSDIACLAFLGLIEIRSNQTILTNAARRVLSETKSWPQMLLIRGSSSLLRHF